VPLSPTTGMVGYPTYIDQGLKVRTLFNPAIKFQGQVTISGSIVTGQGPTGPGSSGGKGNANGTWLVTQLDHALDSIVPNRELFSDMALYSADPRTPPPVVPSSLLG
jgi:hypothetical protein